MRDGTGAIWRRAVLCCFRGEIKGRRLTPPNDEQHARQAIDELLTAAGWAVQDYRSFNPGAAQGIAVREVPLAEGTCDYLLMVDRAAVGIIEAKREGTRLSGVAEQSSFYAGKLPAIDMYLSGKLGQVLHCNITVEPRF